MKKTLAQTFEGLVAGRAVGILIDDIDMNSLDGASVYEKQSPIPEERSDD